MIIAFLLIGGAIFCFILAIRGTYQNLLGFKGLPDKNSADPNNQTSWLQYPSTAKPS